MLERSTWPRPDDPSEVGYALRYGEPTRKQMMWAASVISAYQGLCCHPARNQRTTGRYARRIGRALDEGGDGR